MERVRDAVRELDPRQVDFEYDGEMSADVALDFELMRQLYPFCRLTGAANVLLMPALHSATISAKLLQQLGGGTVYRADPLRPRPSGPDRPDRRDGVGNRDRRGARFARGQCRAADALIASDRFIAIL